MSSVEEAEAYLTGGGGLMATARSSLCRMSLLLTLRFGGNPVCSSSIGYGTNPSCTIFR